MRSSRLKHAFMAAASIMAMASYRSLAYGQSPTGGPGLAPPTTATPTAKHHPTKLTDAQLGKVHGGQNIAEYAVLGALVIITAGALALSLGPKGLEKLTNGGTTAPSIGFG